MRVLAIAATGAADTRAGHLELFMLVVRLIGQQHADLAPTVEEQCNGSGPDHQYDQYDANLNAANLQDEKGE